MNPSRLAALALAALLAAATPQAVAKETHTAEDDTVKNRKDGTKIAITIFKPAGADASARVPVVLHSHGWAGSRSAEVGGVIEEFLDAGFGVVSFDQRGHGDSEGQAHVQDPTRETEDVKAVIDRIAKLPWVRHDKRSNGSAIANDPVLGAIGGSYGGGYQTMTALDEIADEGRTRFNALAPEITWYDLPESLAPQKVARSAWTSALYAAGASMVPDYIHEGFVWGASTGLWPDGTLYGEKNDAIPNLDKIFHKHSPVAFVQKGIRINVPVLFRQGVSDNLFNLNQGLNIFNKAVTKKARRRSLFVGYNGGHALPNAFPPGTASGSDSCSPKGGFTKLTIDFFKRAFAGRNTSSLLPKRYNLTTAAGDKCLHLNKLKAGRKVAVDAFGAGGVISTAGLGVPLNLEIAEGPLRVAGVPKLRGKVTTTGLDARAFFGLSMGTTPADARVIQNNVMPLRQVLPAQDKKFKIELPGVAVEIPERQSLFLTVTPVSDMSFGHGSRVPGAVVMTDVKLSLPAPKGKR